MKRAYTHIALICALTMTTGFPSFATTPPKDDGLIHIEQQVQESLFKDYISLNKNRDLYVINKEHAYVPSPNTTLLVGSELGLPTSYKVEEEAGKALSALLQKGKEAGYTDYKITSIHRTVEEQQTTFDSYLNSYLKNYNYDSALAMTNRYVAPPGNSEHHSGLAVDISSHNRYDYSRYEDVPSLKFFHDNAPDFGFILSYPEHKENITGYHYEPWHYRYVGKDLAQIMAHNQLTLDEFIHNLDRDLVVNGKDTSAFIIKNLEAMTSTCPSFNRDLIEDIIYLPQKNAWIIIFSTVEA